MTLEMKMVGGLVTESKSIIIYATHPNFNRSAEGLRELNEGWYIDYCQVQPSASVLIRIKKNEIGHQKSRQPEE